MIQKVTMYQAVCDGCGRNASQVTDDARESVFSAIRNDGWREIDGKHYCTDCYEYDGETNEYKPKKKED